MKSIYLCGFMGCGKSHVGRRLSKRLNMPLVDLDEYIVQKEKRSIPEIFEQSGEPYFRQLEADCLKELSDGYIVATGGGTLINENTARYANMHGITVFLDAIFPVCYGRIKNDANRPLAVNNTREQLEAIFNARRKIYKAHSAVTVRAAGTGSAITADVIRKVKYYSKGIKKPKPSLKGVNYGKRRTDGESRKKYQDSRKENKC
ncbi:MAG: shikimate kinase [Bacteroides sp.]|nr:shikimate kinase [Bacteroides sp.]